MDLASQQRVQAWREKSGLNEPQVDKETGEVLQPKPPEGEDFSPATLVSMLNRLHGVRAQLAELKKEEARLAGPIRSALEQGQDVYDGETGVRAILQTRKGTAQLDAKQLSEKAPELLTWAASMAALKLDGAVYKALEGKAPEHLRLGDYIYPGAGSEALIVEKEKNRG